jgi:hypothetical protein
MRSLPTISPAQARRIALAAQGLDPSHRESDVMGVMRRLGCIQFDPLNVVARTQLLVLFSRLGAFDPEELDRALFEDRELFHYWAHAASFVLTEDYPIYQRRMRTWPGTGDWAERVTSWMKDNDGLRRHILRELKAKGPLMSRDFEDRSKRDWESSGWTKSQNVGRMLDFLWVQGRIMIAGRGGGQRMWAHADEWFPDWTPKHRLRESAVIESVTVRGLRALGIATPKQVAQHFVTTSHAEARAVLTRLLKKGVLQEFEIAGRTGTWLMHRDDLGLLEEARKGWRGRTTVLSPFDNLIRDRERTKSLFDLDFTIEIYVPKTKRRYGYYVLPVVSGDRIVALIDPKMDRKTGTLAINAIHEGPGKTDLPAAARTRKAIEGLASWLGATVIDYGKVPSGWAKAFD